MLVLRLQCDDRPGIVATVAGMLADAGCNIEESAQFYDRSSGHFFMRVLFRELSEGAGEMFAGKFAGTANDWIMDWDLALADRKTRMLIMVSKGDHCLNDLLYRCRTGSLPVEITAIVSNHDDTKSLATTAGTPFYHWPLTPETRAEQEQKLRGLIAETRTELVVLARYMQILSAAFTDDFAGRIINIHHSFLPGFKGARPYHQAYERGVKIIGATAHYVTGDLDEGPIIAQGVKPVDHGYTPERMQQTGRDIEAQTLAEAVRLFAERRIFLHGNKTVIL